jgi:hypothetical protein
MIELRKLLLLAFIAFFLPGILALDAPSLSSSTHPEGEWAGMPMSFEWSAVEGADEYCYSLNTEIDSDAPNEPCTALLNVQPPQKIKSGDYYFHVKAVSSSEESGTTTYYIKLDIDAPTRPIPSAEPKSDGSIELTWEPSEDDSSGVKEYEIYRKLMAGFDIRTTPIYKTVSGSVTSFNDSNDMAQSTTYHYKMRAIDNSGNSGLVSKEVHAETVAKCDLGVQFSVELSSSQEELQLSITANDKIYRGSLTAKLPDASEHVFFEEAEAFLEWDEDFDLSTIEEGYIDFSLAAEEFFGDDCSQEKQFIYDVTLPEASFVFPKYNDRVSETVPLELGVDDKGSFKSGIQSVTFFEKEGDNWKQLGSGEEGEEGIYTFEWNSFGVENGQQKIKASVVDMAGNSVEAVQTVNVLNAFDSSLDVNAALKKAFTARKNAFIARWGLDAKAISSDGVNALIEQADANLTEAERLSQLPGLENETNAKMMLAQAIVSYKQSEEVVETSLYNSSDFIFNKEQVDILLSAAGISGSMAAQAKAYIDVANPERQLQVLEVRDDNATYYRALIVVSFSLDVNILKDSNIGDTVMQVVEVVPKEFAEYAEELDSNVAFTVLSDDPTLSFSMTREQYKKKKLVYALKKDLSQQQADALIEDNIINKFVAPPVFLPLEGSASVIPFTISTDLLLFIGASVIIVLVVLVVLVVLKKGKRRGPLAKKQPKFSPPKEERKKKPAFWKKGKPPTSGLHLPSIRKKKESPLSVFGKK